MVIEREDHTELIKTDSDIVEPEQSYETIYKNIIQELYHARPSYGRACELIGDLDIVEKRMIADQVIMYDGRPDSDPQKTVDEIRALSKMAPPPKGKHPHHHK